MQIAILKPEINKIIEVNVPLGSEWDNNYYPTAGIYLNTNSNSTDAYCYKIVLKNPDGITAFTKEQFNFLFEITEGEPENKQTAKHEQANHSIGFVSEEALLKAIAISQKPELIKEIGI